LNDFCPPEVPKIAETERQNALFSQLWEFAHTERAFAVLENAAQTVRKSLFDVSSFRVAPPDVFVSIIA
jgi:hypothetical protein